MDELQPLPDPSPQPWSARRPFLAFTLVALLLALGMDGFLLLHKPANRHAAPPPSDPARAKRLWSEAQTQIAAGAGDDQVLPLLEQAIDASPSFVDARLARMRIMLRRCLERWAVLDASPLLGRAHLPRDPTIIQLRMTLLSDATALAAVPVPVADAIEVRAIEAFLTDGPLPDPLPNSVRCLRAWRLLDGGRLHDACRTLEALDDQTATSLARWTRAHCLVAWYRDEPWRDGVNAEANRLLEAIPASQRSAAVLIDLAGTGLHDEAQRLELALDRAPGEPSILARLAEAEERAGHLAQALAWASKAVSGAPDEPGLLLFSARLLARLGRAQEARGVYDRVRRLAPDRPDVLRARAVFLLKTGGADKALGDAGRAQEMDPTPEGLSLVCDAMVANGQAEEALRQATGAARCRALRTLGRNQEAFTEAIRARNMPEAAFALLGLGKMQEAEGYASIGTSVDARFALALVRRAQQRLDDALACVQQALDADPLRAPCIALRGWILHDQSKPDLALAEFKKAIEIDPTCAEAWHGVGVVRLAQGAYEEAGQAFGQAIFLARGDAEAWALRAEAKQRLDDLEGAEKDLDEALRLRVDQPAWLVARSCVKLARKDLAGARADAGKATSLAADSAPAWTAVGLAALAQGEADAAEKALARALALNRGFVPALVGQARLHLERKRRAEALLDLHEALSIEPDSADALILDGQLAVEDARWKDAVADLERFVTSHSKDTRHEQAQSWLGLARRGLSGGR